MIDTTQLDQLIPALLSAQSDFPPIVFDATNPHFRNRYATLASILSQTRPILAKHGLVVSQLIDADAVVTLLLHVSGQRLESRTQIVSEKPGPQAMGSGITYARRYGILAILGIAPEEDDDGEGAQQSPSPAKPARSFGKRATEPPKSSSVAAASDPEAPAWFGEALRGGKYSGRTWRALSEGSLGGDRHQYVDWMATKADRITPETRERAAYVLSLYTKRELGEEGL